MDQEKRKTYTNRISQANRSELVVIIFELMLDSIGEAREALQQGDADTADTELKRARGLLAELRGSLDFQYTISRSLVSLYRYVNEQLVRSIARRKDVQLDSCERVLRGLQQSFEEVAAQDTSGPVVENGQQVYAGLTYGKGSLNEVMLDSCGGERGYQV